ncbi:hypothetical protein E3P98_01151 [Wallemia ichthyophaga]|nr:hypothetical protein E3P98_01151 [Wallemia ichthyophaga]
MSVAKVYCVNGQPSSGASSLPQWISKRRLAAERTGGKSRKRSKAKVKERGLEESQLTLIQEFGFPEASMKVRTSPDGDFALATGTYKPQVRCYDLRELALKWERHTSSENVDFQILSSDWTKSVHLQNDRTVSVHSQSQLHYSLRVPRFGSQVFRLNLEQGRFLNPLDLDSSSVQGVNAVDVNPAHQLWSFGVEGSGAGVKFWDPRSRNEIGSLDLPAEYLVEDNIANLGSGPLGVTSLASHSNGLSMAVGTSTGHTLLYDLRASKPFASKDQGYGLPIKNLQWLESASGRYDEADGKVASADSKVIKIWDKESTENYVNLTPESDINDMHIVPKTGLIMLANEAPEMSSYYVPQLGPAPKWCRFLDNITEELEGDMSGGVGPSAWSDYKFIDKSELESLQLNHLIGTAALKPYMHGFFISGELYSTAKLVSNPFAYAEHREKEIQAKLDKQAESRIRNSVKPNVKINKGLVDKLSKSSSKKSKKDDGKLLSDDRFKDMFENPEFEIDEDSKEFALRNPSGFNKGKTAVEQEEEESDKDSMDEDMSKGSSSEGEEEGDSGDESEDNIISAPPPRQPTAPVQKPKPQSKPTLVAGTATEQTGSAGDAFGDRIKGTEKKQQAKESKDSSSVRRTGGGGMEMVFTPKTTEADDNKPQPKKAKGREQFGHGLEKGALEQDQGADEQVQEDASKHHQSIANQPKSLIERVSRADRDGKIKLQGIPVFTDKMEEREWIKEHMAAVFRFWGKMGYGEGLAGHITVVDPVEPSCYWMNPICVHFGIMTKSKLVLVGPDGYIRPEGAQLPINTAGFYIHSAIHKARPDVKAAGHTHTVYGKAWSVFGKPIDMLSQDSCLFYNNLGVYKNFGGIVLAHEEGENVAKSLGTSKNCILQNHGLLTVGETVDEMAHAFHALERACHVQLLSESAASNGHKINTIDDEDAAFTAATLTHPEAAYLVQDLTPYDVKSYIEKAKNIAMNVPEMEAKVNEATNDDPCSTLMQQIAQGTFNFQEFNEILPTIYRKFMEMEARQWRQIYKALQLLEYLVKHGSERVVDDARAHLSTIKMLRNFHFIDDKSKDQGINVRNRAMEIISLLSDVDKIRAERRKAKANRSKYVGVGSEQLSGVSFNMGGSRYGGFGSDSLNTTNTSYSGGGGFSDAAENNQGYDDYDAGDDDDRAEDYHENTPASSTSQPPQQTKQKEPEVDLFDFGDEPASAPPVAPTAAPVQAPPKTTQAGISEFDDFDDFQSAPVSKPKAPASTQSIPNIQPPMGSQSNALSSIPPTMPMSGLQSLQQPAATPPAMAPQPAINPATMPNRANVPNQQTKPNDPFSGFDDLWKSSKSTKQSENTAKPSMASMAQQKSSASLWNTPTSSKPQPSQPSQQYQTPQNNDDLLL